MSGGCARRAISHRTDLHSNSINTNGCGYTAPSRLDTPERLDVGHRSPGRCARCSPADRLLSLAFGLKAPQTVHSIWERHATEVSAQSRQRIAGYSLRTNALETEPPSRSQGPAALRDPGVRHNLFGFVERSRLKFPSTSRDKNGGECGLANRRGRAARRVASCAVDRIPEHGSLILEIQDGRRRRLAGRGRATQPEDLGAHPAMCRRLVSGGGRPSPETARRWRVGASDAQKTYINITRDSIA
ncbi:hypothetical protein EVAR_37320_1 [Eumeta japonica]|uniref:Uncharacterized protein n=1 Tax=Eumeta variegata TaxID=151549 RepID=A0A4C1X1Q6_EUMVA|nr:hypothetical protein EVAR_37320_1 [Eumeta japonica]